LANGNVQFETVDNQIAFSEEHNELMQYDIEEIEVIELKFDEMNEIIFSSKEIMMLEGVVNFVE
jgi:DNA repair ATPase RecN